jgi:outer membrane receptor protein involved in Fe transport
MNLNKEKTIKLYLILFIWLICSNILGQSEKLTYSIKGQIVDSISNEEIPYPIITVIIKNEPIDSLTFTANEVGKFEINLKEAPSYYLLIRSLGKESFQREFFLTKAIPFIDFGKILLKDDHIVLKEVLITTQNPLVKIDLDKIIYNIGEDPAARTSSVFDILRKVPMITIEGDDIIKLKGSTNFKVFRNGKPYNLAVINPSEVLKNIPANTLKNIEVITDPGAKYDAEGIGGIININTKNINMLQGFTGVLNVAGNSIGYIGGGGYLSIAKGKLGLTTQYNYANSDIPWVDNKTLREYIQNNEQFYTLEKGQTKQKGRFQLVGFETSYEIDTLNLLTVGFNLMRKNMKNISENKIYKGDDLESIFYDYSRNTISKSTVGLTNINVDYQRYTRKKGENITISYRLNNLPDDNDYYTNIFEKEINQYMENQSINKASTNEHTWQIDYTTPIKSGHLFDVGAKYILRQNNSQTEYYLSENKEDNEFNYEQQIYAGYLSYTMQISKFGVKSGVRGEISKTDAEFGKIPDNNFSKNMYDLVPNFNLFYKLSNIQQLQFGYNMRINRPSIWYLNPYIDSSNPEQISYGNPLLNTEKAHNINLTFSSYNRKFNFSGAINYSFSNNLINQNIFIDSTNLTHYTYNNAGKRRQIGGYLYINWNPFNIFRINFNGNLNYIKLKNIEKHLTNEGISTNLYLSGYLNLPNNFSSNIIGSYNSPSINLFGKGYSFYFVELYVNKDIMKKKMTISIFIENPFFKDVKLSSNISDSNMNIYNTTYRVSNFVGFKLSYRFGSLKSNVKKVKQSIVNDDLKEKEDDKSTQIGF